jgi:alpha-ribazole phosphatase
MKTWTDIQDPQLQHWFDNWLDATPTGGESFASMIVRVKEFMETLKTQPFHDVIIFTHAGVIRAAGILAGTFQAAEAFDYKVGYGDAFKITI